MALDCQLETEYTDAEWRAFVDCAREGMTTGERLHHEFDAKLAEHQVSPREAEHSIASEACLSFYVKDGLPRLGLWNPRSEIMIVGTVPDGLVLTAFPMAARRAKAYVERQTGHRWLRR